MTTPPSSSSIPVSARFSTEIPALRQRENAESDAPPPSSKAAMRAYGPIVPRDTDATAFTKILDDLIQRIPGAFAAALVDGLGETVDYSGRGDPFDLKIAAAHLQILVANLERLGSLGDPRWLVVRGPKKSVAATVLPDGYALALLLRSRSAFSISTRALKVATRALAHEAGWDAEDMKRHDGVKQRSWFPVIVQTDGRGRPLSIVSQAPGGARIPVEVLGMVMGLSVRERGFRVRTQDGAGAELTLVREPRDRWYADEGV